MAENALQTAQSLSASDRAFIAEVDCLGQRVDLYESQLDEPCVHANRPMTLEEHFKSIDLRFASFALQINERFKAIDERLKAIGERSKARHEKIETHSFERFCARSIMLRYEPKTSFCAIRRSFVSAQPSSKPALHKPWYSDAQR